MTVLGGRRYWLCMSDWTIRPYDPTRDEKIVTYLWLKSFAHSPLGRSQGASIDGSPAEISYLQRHREVVKHCLEKGTTQVVVDPEVTDVVWAFACCQGDIVHYAVVKRRFRESAAEMFQDLFGDLTGRLCSYTHDFSGTGFKVPKSWVCNPYAILERSK